MFLYPFSEVNESDETNPEKLKLGRVQGCGGGGADRKKEERKSAMMKWEGFAYAAGAAVGHSCIDVSRKMASQHFNPVELIALVGLLDALLLSAFLWAFGSKEAIGSLSSVWEGHFGDEKLLKILVISSGLKVMAGFMYQRALQVSPMSVTIPYLAFTPVLLVFTSYFLMNEVPSARGLLGVVVVTVGGYMLVLDRSLDGHAKTAVNKGDEPGDSLDVSWPAETKKLSSFKSFSRWVVSSHVFEPLLALRREEGSLLMLGVAGVFSISNSLDKMGAHLSPSSVSFAAVQRVIMAIPVVFYLILVSPRSFKHLFRWFPAFLIVSFFEVVAFICYLKSLESLLVSYAIAAKRSNVLLSVIVGRVVFKVSMVLNIPKRKFMMLVHEGSLLIHKDDVQSANYINAYQSFLAPTELEDLNNLLKGCHMGSQEQVVASTLETVQGELIGWKECVP